jgi:UDP-N-acetylmuramoyl-L-alanyl-D-glutamate--2,6-diaminopimelate ligase
MPGIFNVSNALAAIGIANYYNIPEKYIVSGLKSAKVPGRMELYKSKDEKILGIVDYAHNKLSFEKMYETIKYEYPERKILTVFGCPGNKAYSRRKDLGIISGNNSDKIILTADDPGYEKVIDICNEIASYIKLHNSNFDIIEDRKEAVKEAINYVLMQKDSYILLILR